MTRVYHRKVCTKCGLSWALRQYHRNTYRPDGRSSECIHCYAIRRRGELEAAEARAAAAEAAELAELRSAEADRERLRALAGEVPDYRGDLLLL